MFREYPRYLLIKIIRFYQQTLSLDHGIFRKFFPNGYCRFHPTCSEYVIQSYEKYGVIKGTVKTVWRLLRCNPWSKGGIDPA